MRRIILISILSPLVGLWFFAGCGLDSGRGWTRVAAQAHVQWNQDGRLQNDGRFKTSKSYQIQFEAVEVAVENIRFETVADDVGGGFDPSNPPEGYSLCHNGHCHNEAGELIDYEDILLELGQASSSATVVEQAVEQPVTLDTSAEITLKPLNLGGCNDSRQVCEIGPQNLRSVAASLSRLGLKMKVFHEDKLPVDGIELEVEIIEPVQLEKFYPTSLGSDADQVLRLGIELQLGTRIWDAVEFSEFVIDEEVQTSALSEKIAQAVKHNGVLTIKTMSKN